MKDGSIQGNKVWFGFDVDELWWLYELIPRGDTFKDTVGEALRALEQELAK